MGDRGTELMTKASRQLDEMAEFFATLDDADLGKACPDESAGDGAGDTVGEVASHAAEGYHLLGRFLQSAGYIQGSPATGDSHGHRRGNGHGHVPAALPDVLERLSGGRSPIGLLANLPDGQFDSVPAAGSSRFSDGRRTLEQVIDVVIAHQAAHLVAVKRAVA